LKRPDCLTRFEYTRGRGSKRVELLKDMIQDASRVAVLWNPANKSKVTEWSDTQKAAKTTGLSLISVEVRGPEEIEGAFASILREGPDAI
jgi:putative ABC transport system substrate-binding protein